MTPNTDERFLGVWQLVEAHNDGVRTLDEIVERFQFRVLTDRVQVIVEDETVVMEAENHIDASREPAESETILPDGTAILGILKIEDGNLMSCVALPGAPRPTEFSSHTGSGWSNRILRRVRDI